jgi:hypothetical protein
MTRAINTGPKFGSREQVIAETRAYGTLSRDGCSSPDLFAGGLKLMISRWRSAGIQGSSATAGEQAAQTAYRSGISGRAGDRPDGGPYRHQPSRSYPMELRLPKHATGKRVRPRLVPTYRLAPEARPKCGSSEFAKRTV